LTNGAGLKRGIWDGPCVRSEKYHTGESWVWQKGRENLVGVTSVNFFHSENQRKGRKGEGNTGAMRK